MNFMFERQPSSNRMREKPSLYHLQLARATTGSKEQPTIPCEPSSKRMNMSCTNSIYPIPPHISLNRHPYPPGTKHQSMCEASTKNIFKRRCGQ